MEELEKILKECLGKGLSRIIISNVRTAGDIRKVVVKPFEEKKKLYFQFAKYTQKQVFHTNMEQSEAVAHILQLMRESFKQMEIFTDTVSYSVLVSKKGKVTIKKKKSNLAGPIDLSHNRKKRYLLPDDEPVPFLVELGVQTKEGKIVDRKYSKFRQINRFLEFIRDVMPVLSEKAKKNGKLTIVDFGCGKSYLTFAMYHYLKIQNGYEVQMIGLDLKTDVIRHCNELAEKLGYDELTFLEGDISSYEGLEQVDMVVTLHACDTATDYALDKAVRWGAEVILSVPCCQHEFNAQIRSECLQPLLKYGILKERMAALVTDSVRAGILEEKGYEVQILEFIDMEHTPKNLLIRAVKKAETQGKKSDWRQMCVALGIHGTLEQLLGVKDDENE